MSENWAIICSNLRYLSLSYHISLIIYIFRGWSSRPFGGRGSCLDSTFFFKLFSSFSYLHPAIIIRKHLFRNRLMIHSLSSDFPHQSSPGYTHEFKCFRLEIVSLILIEWSCLSVFSSLLLYSINGLLLFIIYRNYGLIWGNQNILVSIFLIFKMFHLLHYIEFKV
jgi:hypothetical protein